MGRGKFQRGLALVLIAGLVLTSMPVTTKAAVKSAYTIGVGKSVTGSVSARITKISVNNKKIATVTKISRKKFRIKGVKPGKTVVTVKYGSKKTKKINVSVGATSIKKKTTAIQKYPRAESKLPRLCAFRLLERKGMSTRNLRSNQI